MLNTVDIFSVFEAPAAYSSHRENFIYDISFKTSGQKRWLGELAHAHRTVQTLLHGQYAGWYTLEGLILWPEGIHFRLRLKESRDLTGLFQHLREKSTPAGSKTDDWWDSEPQTIRMIQPGKENLLLHSFSEKVSAIRKKTQASGADPCPSLAFFYYSRDPLAA